MAIQIINNSGKSSGFSSAISNYDGEKTGGELRAMPKYGTDPNDFIRRTYNTLSDRNATLYHTSALARACVNKPLSYSIGDGIVFRSRPSASMLGMSKESAKDWGNRFSQLLHYEKLAVGYYEKQALLVRDAKITGDSVLFFLKEEDTDIPFDLISAGGHIIDATKTDANYNLGIKNDIYSRRTGFFSALSQSEVPFVNPDGSRNAIQMMYKERSGQMRGNGAYYSEIARSKNLDRVWDAVIERVAQEATILGYSKASETDVRRQIQGLAKGGISIGKALGQQQYDPQIRQMQADQLSTGGFMHLKNDEEMDFLEMKAPGNNFDTINEWAVNMFGMSTGYAPEFLMGKYHSSYSASRSALNDTWKKIKQDRSTFIHVVDRNVNLEYLKYFIATGQIEAPKDFTKSRAIRLASISGSHLGPVPGHINPLQEVNAEIKADNAGYMTKSDIAQKYGNSNDDDFEQWGEEQRRWAELSPEMQAKTLQEDSRR